jgi:predicted dehydrogenase
MRFCAIGLGRMGRRHLQIVNNLGYTIAGVYDPLSSSVEQAIKEFNLPQEVIFDSAETMLKTVKPDALVIASTAPSHCDYVCMAAEVRVRYVLCEKPLAVSIEQCDRMIAACEASGTLLAVNHQMMFMEQYSLVKEMVSSNVFGGLRSVTVSASNFGLAMNGAHYFEMFRYLTGEEIDTISFWADEEKVPNPRGSQYEDISGQLRALTLSGIRLYMEIGGDQGHGIQVIYGCRYGQILVDELEGFVRAIHRKSEFLELPTTRYGMPGEIFIQKILSADVITPTEDLWRAMIAGDNYPDGQCGRHAVRALVSANLSAQALGSTLSLNEVSQSKNLMFPWA